jgi:hypothetical protein
VNQGFYLETTSKIRVYLIDQTLDIKGPFRKEYIILKFPDSPHNRMPNQQPSKSIFFYSYPCPRKPKKNQEHHEEAPEPHPTTE